MQATEMPISSCFARTIGATAMIAVQPQIAVPAASSRWIPCDTLNALPSATAAIIATEMQAITTGTATTLTPANTPSVRRRPISAMPIRSSVRPANSVPASAQEPGLARLRHRMPSRIAHRIALTVPPLASETALAPSASAMTKARPGRTPRSGPATALTDRLQECRRVGHHARLDRAVHLCKVADVYERVGIEDHEVGELPGLDLAGLAL